MNPWGGLVIDSAGNLYGTTAYGGTGGCILLGILYGCGTVYEVSPPQQKGGQWTEAILYSFQSGNDGYFPWGNLTLDKSGNLYGATQFGGGKGTQCNPYYQYCGTVFKMSPPKQKGGVWTEQVLHSFAGGTDGANPNGGLVLDSKGIIYGTTYSGGNSGCKQDGSLGCGTAFELRPPTTKGGTWGEKGLHRFDRTNSDGGNPMAGLTFGADRKLYGTTIDGGPGSYGTVFCLSKKVNSWAETVLYGFDDGADGAGPEAGLTFDSHGNVYGTTSIATNRSSQGNVFMMPPPPGTVKPGLLAWSTPLRGRRTAPTRRPV